MRGEARHEFWGLNVSTHLELSQHSHWSVTLDKFGTFLCLGFLICERELLMRPTFPICEKFMWEVHSWLLFLNKLSPTLSQKAPHIFLEWEFPSMKMETSKKTWPLSWIVISISKHSFTPSLSPLLCNSQLSLLPSLRSWFLELDSAGDVKY